MESNFWSDQVLYQEYAEGIPPPPLPVDLLYWRPEYPLFPSDDEYFPVELMPNYATERPKTVSWVIPEKGNVIYATVNTQETWEEHFASRGWQSPQDQINAGFPYYLQPTMESGFYEEVWDIGEIFHNVIVNVDFSTTPIAGQVGVTVKLATSVDNASFTPFVNGTSLFVADVRYVKLRIEFMSTE